MKKLLIVTLFFILIISPLIYADGLKGMSNNDDATIGQYIYLSEGRDAKVLTIINLPNDTETEEVVFFVKENQKIKDFKISNAHAETDEKIVMDKDDFQFIYEQEDKTVSVSTIHSSPIDLHIECEYVIENYTYERSLIYTYVISDDIKYKHDVENFNLFYYSPLGYYFNNLDNLETFMSVLPCSSIGESNCQERLFLNWNNEKINTNSRIYFSYKNEEKVLQEQIKIAINMGVIFMVFGFILGVISSVCISIIDDKTKFLKNVEKNIKTHITKKIGEISKKKW
ncbi:MAG: hypothetical protein KJ697_04105 [Nanoarchaeota archaeon]|nr:hypothetical protein [Nanoarchaeota archaeon]